MLYGAQAHRAGLFTENQSTVHLYSIRYRSAPPQTAIRIGPQTARSPLAARGKPIKTKHFSSTRQAYQNEALLILSYVGLCTKGLQPSCAQSRLAQNQNCFRLGHGRFPEVPFINFVFLST